MKEAKAKKSKPETSFITGTFPTADAGLTPAKGDELLIKVETTGELVADNPADPQFARKMSVQ
jgi:hypothetical protein